jgi:hypothetical protein
MSDRSTSSRSCGIRSAGFLAIAQRHGQRNAVWQLAFLGVVALKVSGRTSAR